MRIERAGENIEPFSRNTRLGVPPERGVAESVSIKLAVELGAVPQALPRPLAVQRPRSWPYRDQKRSIGGPLGAGHVRDGRSLEVGRGERFAGCYVLQVSDGIPLGPYVLRRKLAQGGMAEVYLGRKNGHQGFERDLVIKRMLPHLAGNEDHVRLFRDEARIAGRMNHPNVVHVYDFGETDTTAYLVMELVRGVDLRALIERARVVAKRSGRGGAVPSRHAAKMMSFVCEGLAHAHDLTDAGKRLSLIHI